MVWWNFLVMMSMSIPIMWFMWALANDNAIQHFLACHFEYGARSCSFCSHYHFNSEYCISQLKKQAIMIKSMMVLLKPLFERGGLIIPLLLILLSGDVELNPGPGKPLRYRSHYKLHM